MEFVCYSHWDQLPQSVDQLFTRSEKESIFFSRTWFENLLRNGLEAGHSTLFACVQEGDEVLAILPMSADEGGHYQSLKNLYSSLYTLPLAEGRQREILACLVEGLRQLPLKYLQMDPVAELDRTMELLQEAFEASGYSCQRYFRFYNWVYKTNGKIYADYLAERPGKVRSTIQRKQRKLAREHSYRIRLFTADDLDQGLDDYLAVYNASWKAHEQFPGFVEGLAAAFARRDWLRLAILYIDNAPAAAQFWFVAHGKASIFKLAYDQAWKQYSPGTILTAFLMEHVIDIDRVKEIDFLTGNDRYKQEWMSERRERWRLCCFTTQTTQNLRHRLSALFPTLLKWAKRSVYN
jgi:hypothetical protein